VITSRLRTVVSVTRAPFFVAEIIPVLVGTMVAWRAGYFRADLFVLTLIGMICVNAALNMSNDYFDHLSGNDEANQEPTPFSGGSRTIQNGVLAPRQVLMWSLFFYLMATLIGLYLAWARGLFILWVGLAGILMAFFHNAPPVRLYYLAPGVGELAIGLGSGPLVVLGSYYVQTQSVSWEALWVSVPIGLLVTAILYGNEFPDYWADKSVGKKTLPAVLGQERAAWGYAGIILGAFLVTLAGIAAGVLPYALLLVLPTLALALRSIRGMMRNHSNTELLVPALATTIQLYVAFGMLVCLGYAVARLVG